MKALLLIFCIPLLVFPQSRSGKQNYSLPQGALVIETRAVKANRILILWMLRPARHPRGTPQEPYTCPEETRGSYYSGRTRVSLFDAGARKIINTVKITEEYSQGGDEFDLPYKIHKGYYHVGGVAGEREGQPTLIFLKDYNGDGKALEFALFNAEACMGLQTTLIGYSESQDKVIQYPISLTVVQKGERTIENGYWADYLFSKEPVSRGHWKYEIDYRGRGGTLDRYDVRYDPRAERFEGTLESIEDEQK